MTFTTEEVALIIDLSNDRNLEDYITKDWFPLAFKSLLDKQMIHQYKELRTPIIMLTRRGWAVVNRGIYDEALSGTE